MIGTCAIDEFYQIFFGEGGPPQILFDFWICPLSNIGILYLAVENMPPHYLSLGGMQPKDDISDSFLGCPSIALPYLASLRGPRKNLSIFD